MTYEGIVAVGLLTKRDLDALGAAFTRAWPVENTPCFSQILKAIDQADRNQRQRAMVQDAPAR